MFFFFFQHFGLCHLNAIWPPWFLVRSQFLLLLRMIFSIEIFKSISCPYLLTFWQWNVWVWIFLSLLSFLDSKINVPFSFFFCSCFWRVSSHYFLRYSFCSFLSLLFFTFSPTFSTHSLPPSLFLGLPFCMCWDLDGVPRVSEALLISLYSFCCFLLTLGNLNWPEFRSLSSS